MPKSKKFKKLIRKVKKQYVGKKVPKMYGKIYDAEEAERIAFAIAQKLGWHI